jgi:antirestriction protein
MSNDDFEPEVWVGCLACYNAGTLRGEWVDAREAGNFEPCEGRGHEEFWCMDHQGFEGFLTGECSPMEAQEIATAVDALADTWRPVAAIAAYCNYYGHKIGEITGDQFDEAYRGEWHSEEEYAEEFADSCGLIDSDARWPVNYIDWERAARDLFMDGHTSVEAPGGLIYVFDDNV